MLSASSDPAARRSLVRRVVDVLRRRPTLAAGFVVGSGMHAFGHAILAAAAGHLTRHLAGNGAPMDARSIAGMPGIAEHVARQLPLALAVAGALAALFKLVGGVLAARSEATVAGLLGSELRRDVLQNLLFATSRTSEVRDADEAPTVHRLRRARQLDHGPASERHSVVASPVSPRGTDLASLTSHVQEVERGVAQGVFTELRAVVQLVPLALLLGWLAPSLALSALAVLGAFGGLVFATRRALKRGHRRAALEAATMLGAADEAVRHAELWTTFGAEARVIAHLERLGSTMVRTARSLRVRSALLSGTSEVMGALALVLALLLVSIGLIRGVDHGSIVAFAIAFFMTYRPLRDGVEARLARARGEEALALALREAKDVRLVEVQAPTPRWSPGVLELDGLASMHGSHAPVSTRIAPGSIVAIIGPTGVGKSSLFRVLLGLEAPRRGRVRFAGRDITTAPRGHGRPFAWVPQHAPVLGDTLAANVALGTDDDAAAATFEAMAALGATDLLTHVGEARLVTEREVSGGERQWIATARALASKAPVLLLDEPTSQLDPDAQAAMLAALARLRGERTVVVITHRPEPLAIADVVLRLTPDGSGDADDGHDGTGFDLDLVGS